MRTLAPIRVRKCDCGKCTYFLKWVCRLCGASNVARDPAQAHEFGLLHLSECPQLDNRNGSE